LASRSWIIFFTDTDDTISPSPEAIPLWKKNFSSNRPCGVSTYLLVVTRSDGGLVHADVLAHVAQRQRAQVRQPFVQEIALELHRSTVVTLRRVRWRWSNALDEPPPPSAASARL